jgi:hypothetical protein
LAGAGRPCSCKLTVRSLPTVTAKRTAAPAPLSWIACYTLSPATSSLVLARVMTTSFEAIRVARSFHPVVIMLRLRSTSFGQVCMRQPQSAAAGKLSRSARANLRPGCGCHSSRPGNDSACARWGGPGPATPCSERRRPAEPQN